MNRYNITAEGDLVIRDVSFTDVGTYQCYAKNKFGETSAYGSLVVKSKDTCPPIEPAPYTRSCGPFTHGRGTNIVDKCY